MKGYDKYVLKYLNKISRPKKRLKTFEKVVSQLEDDLNEVYEIKETTLEKTIDHITNAALKNENSLL